MASSNARPASRFGRLGVLAILSCLASGATGDPLWTLEDWKNGKTLSREACADLQDAVWVEGPFGTRCIRYFASPRARGAAHVVVGIHGDVTSRHGFGKTSRESLLKNAERYERQLGIPVVLVGRSGTYGSSGHYLKDRHRFAEMWVMHASLDAIKARLGISRLALAGQSAGAGISIAMLALGRRDVSCVGAGSGGYGMREPDDGPISPEASLRELETATGSTPFRTKNHLAQVPVDRDRRVFVITDPQDLPYRVAGARYVAKTLRALGHAAHLVEKKSDSRKDHHNLWPSALEAAAACARGAKAEAVIARLGATSPDSDADELSGDGSDADAR